MNSEVVSSNFASNNTMLYGAHYITLINDVTYENNIGQFVMTYATPNASKDPRVRTLPRASTRNVINKDNVKVSSISTGNCISIEIPKHLFYITKLEIEPNITTCSHCGGVSTCSPKVKIERKEYKSGQKFVVVNAGGEVDKPCIVGVI